MIKKATIGFIVLVMLIAGIQTASAQTVDTSKMTDNDLRVLLISLIQRLIALETLLSQQQSIQPTQPVIQGEIGAATSTISLPPVAAIPQPVIAFSTPLAELIAPTLSASVMQNQSGPLTINVGPGLFGRGIIGSFIVNVNVVTKKPLAFHFEAQQGSLQNIEVYLNGSKAYDGKSHVIAPSNENPKLNGYSASFDQVVSLQPGDNQIDVYASIANGNSSVLYPGLTTLQPIPECATQLEFSTNPDCRFANPKITSAVVGQDVAVQYVSSTDQ